jgi:hypothetical protein
MFPATGIITCLQNGGTIEHAQQIAPVTTKLYDRTNDAISLDETACPFIPGIEWILISGVGPDPRVRGCSPSCSGEPASQM